MSKRNEKISAHLDGEIHHDELMAFSLSGETEDSQTSMRYRLIGDALRGELSELSMQDVSHAVREALIDENIEGQVSATRPQVFASPDKSPSGWLSAGWLKPLGGMAIAASVAVTLVMVVTQQDSGRNAQMASVKHEAPAPVMVASDKASAPAPIQSVPVSRQSELNPYLNQHFATQGTLQSRMPYVRAVSYESEK